MKHKWILIISGVLLFLGILSCKEKNPVASISGIVGDPSKASTISIVGLTPGAANISGTANNLDTSKVRVVLWVKTDQWYVQPLIADPWTYVRGDGNWTNWTHPWNRALALLVDPKKYVPGSTRQEHPSGDSGVLAWSEYPGPSTDRIITFSGFHFKVKKADLAGPGPNYFSDSTDNVWLDGSSNLHLKLTQRDGHWYCAEVFLDHSLGYGAYTYHIASRVDSLDYNIVFSGFTYGSATNELDIEWSRYLANPYNMQYVVQPWHNPGNLTRFPMPKVQNSSHRIEWRADKIVFTSWKGLSDEPSIDSLINTWTYTGADIPAPGIERMRFNLWLINGSSPTNNQGAEVIVTGFQFNP